MRLRDMNCVRFRHRANAKEDFSLNHLVNEKFSLALPCRRLRQADPRRVRRQTLLRRVARPLLSETPLSLLWMRCPRSTLVRGTPLPVSPAASPLALHCPTLSKQCFRFTLHLIPRRSRHVFRPYCLSSASIQRFLHIPRPRTTFTKLRDRKSLPELV